MKLFKKRSQSIDLEINSDGVCKYCGRHLPVSYLKKVGAFFSCTDSDSCLDYQSKNDCTDNNDDISDSFQAKLFQNEEIDNDSDSILYDGVKEQQLNEVVDVDYTSNFDFKETLILENEEMPKNPIDKINDTIYKFQNVLDQELRAIEESLKNSSGNAHQKIHERKAIARKLDLDRKIIEIYEEIKYYPSWSKRENWLRYRDFELDEPQETNVDHERVISFNFKGNQYCFKYIDNGSSTDFDGEYFHHTKLIVQDSAWKSLIEIKISVEYDYITELKPFDITAFLPGDWMKDFLEGYEKMRFTKKRKELLRKYDADEVNTIKENFGLE